MKEYDLYVPLVSNHGRPLPPARLQLLKKQLVKKFGGLTHFPQKNRGLWKVGAVTFVDAIVILRVLSPGDDRSFWKKLKSQLQREWDQKDVLIVARNVTVL